jgi:hypothetical protein
MHNVNLYEIVTMNPPPVQQTYPNKKINGKEKDPLEGLEGKLPKEEHKF